MAPGRYDDEDTATLARRILELERGSATPEEAVDQPEWMDLMEALWGRLRAEGGSRQGLRVPTTSIARLQRHDETFSAHITNVSHGGIKIVGPGCKDLTRGEAVSWVGSQVEGADIPLKVPCEVLWVSKEDGQEPGAGLGFNQSERPQWGKQFFQWYLYAYHAFLEELSRGG